MATAPSPIQQGALEKAFKSKNYKCADGTVVARALALAQQLHMDAETFANQYDSHAIIHDWSMDVTLPRLKVVCDYLEKEQKKENAKPRPAAAVKGMPQAMRPTWEDMTDKVDYTPSAKRQALDPSAANPLTGPKSAGGSQAAKGGASNPLSAAPRAQQPGSAAWSLTPGGAAGLGAAAATPGTAGPPSAFAQRTNRGQTVAVLNDHVSAAAAAGRQQAAGGVRVRPLGQPQLSSSGHTFMSEPLENKIHALDERIMDFADALTALAEQQRKDDTLAAPCPTPGPGPAPVATPGASTPQPHAGTPPPAPAPAGTPGGPAITPQPGMLSTPGGDGATTPTPMQLDGPNGGAAAGAGGADADALVPRPLLHSVSDICPQPVWVAGRVVAEAEGAPLNAESLLLEGCREASGGARVRLDVSNLPSFRVFPGQSVCVYGLNPTGHVFIAQRVVTHVPPPLPAAESASTSGAGSGLGPTLSVSAADRQGGLSMVVAAGPYTLSDNLSYEPLEDLLSYCSANPPDVLLLLGPFVDGEHPAVAKGTLDAPLDAVFRERVAGRVAGWRAQHPDTCLVLMPAVRDVAGGALPVLPQPPLALPTGQAALGPADKVVSLQNPSTAAVGPLVLAAGSSDLLKAMAGADLSRAAPGQPAGERLPALGGHVLGQRSLYPLYPAPLGTCLDTSHYSQLQLPVTPDLLLLPSDLAPFAKLLQPTAWAANGAPGAQAAAVAGASQGGGSNAVSAAVPVVVVNPGRLSRGGAGGTFAQVVVAPGAGSVVERMRVEVKRV